MDKKLNEKRLLYNKSEDLHFITYNILLILYHLGCIDEKKELKDYRKLSFLISIVPDDKITLLVKDYYDMTNIANESIKDSINKLYFQSIENIILIRYVLLILEERHILKINNKKNSSNIYLVNVNKYKEFLISEKFEEEIKNIKVLKKNISRLSSIKYITFIDKLFKKNGVAVWEV
ncbi:hypothetical protein [Clostridium sp. LCP25S3_F10]|uniref:hypothetical protein n=1 Tax=Clostridium sp. LCP25S3_F10 TaxID=3438750 RepID=UPI003F90B225